MSAGAVVTRAVLSKNKKKMTYASAGVDIELKSVSVSALLRTLKYRRHGIGTPVSLPHHYAGCVSFGKYLLCLCTDGVGTKLLVAKALNKWDTVGIDCIAMNVNDMICIGAEPLAFVDYIAVSSPDPAVTEQIGIGLEKGAREARISLIGGETAVMPEIVREFDLAGTCLGVVAKNKLITGKKIKPGDIILGLRSSGIHSNGLTLARKVIEAAGLRYDENVKGLERSLGYELLEPTRIYVKPVLALLKNYYQEIHALAHITGGGLRNLSRLKRGVGFVLDAPFRPHRIFELLQELGNIDNSEMYQTFNMGMGFVIIANQAKAERICTFMNRYVETKIVGYVEKGAGVRLPELGLKYIKY